MFFTKTLLIGLNMFSQHVDNTYMTVSFTKRELCAYKTIITPPPFIEVSVPN